MSRPPANNPPGIAWMPGLLLYRKKPDSYIAASEARRQ